jgi:hypothetical protein
MKKKSIFLFVVFLVLISTLGVFTIGAINHTEDGTCPIAMGSDCSYMDNAIAMASHHISGIQALSEGVTTSSLSIALILLSVAFVLLFIKPANFLDNLVTNFRYFYTRPTTYPVFLRILKWIALRNKLDTYAYARANSDFRL